MSRSKRRTDQVQGQVAMDRKFANARRTPSPGLPPATLANYRAQILDEVEAMLDQIVAQARRYSPKPGQRDVALAEMVALLAEKVIEINALLKTLAQAEALATPGGKK